MAARVLICGIGIAGPTLAWWLERRGFEVTLLERAPALRDSGYMVDFWGPGFDVAERMGLLPRLQQESYAIEEVRFVNERGRRVGGFRSEAFRAALDTRLLSIPRGELARLLFESLPAGVEVIFGDSVRELQDLGAAVRVQFEHAAPRTFDLVVGADGQHSGIRALAFGPEATFERRLGYFVASFDARGYAHRDEGTFVGFCIPGRQVARYSLRGDRTGFFFMFREDLVAQTPCPEPGECLRRLFGREGWECTAILDQLESVQDLYFDSVSQIRLPGWSCGRIGLVGDAAFAPSVLAGEGSSFAMTAAYVLAGELARAPGEYELAFDRYERELRGLVVPKQESALHMGARFAPRTRVGIALRNRVSRWLDVRWVGRLALRDLNAKGWRLPAYH
jgi:2-polyprenyl-6-methoxyphenol hydroxylase-like FAD-dependent oxidoreductase